MKFVIALFALLAVAHAYPGIYGYSEPVAQPWQAPDPWQAAAPWQAPSYVKVAAPPIVKVAAPQVHAPEVHHAIQIPQQQSVPPPHPQPLNIKIPHIPIVKIPYHGAKVITPHLIGVEQYVEPVKIVKAPVHHQPWD
ncbi:uncharacterized protein LOC114873464 [Osmia bicornis bicornis]|uniref:uncharacterized protein LOC114873464 n=1 Tax=Osmia bicornis bicornis TaxID=1437191 RepID=UPI0010F57A7A|nr:uncharacterized protein LOC114873464 [Osmia bicornis bicornis]